MTVTVKTGRSPNPETSRRHFHLHLVEGIGRQTAISHTRGAASPQASTLPPKSATRCPQARRRQRGRSYRPSPLSQISKATSPAHPGEGVRATHHSNGDVYARLGDFFPGRYSLCTSVGHVRGPGLPPSPPSLIPRRRTRFRSGLLPTGVDGGLVHVQVDALPFLGRPVGDAKGRGRVRLSRTWLRGAAAVRERGGGGEGAENDEGRCDDGRKKLMAGREYHRIWLTRLLLRRPHFPRRGFAGPEFGSGDDTYDVERDVFLLET